MSIHGIDLIFVVLLVVALSAFIINRIAKFSSNAVTRNVQTTEALQNEVAALRAEVHALREERSQ